MNELAKCSPIYTKGRKVYRPIWPIQTRLWFWSGHIKAPPYNDSSGLRARAGSWTKGST